MVFFISLYNISQWTTSNTRSSLDSKIPVCSKYNFNALFDSIMAAVGCGDDAHMDLSAAQNYIMKFETFGCFQICWPCLGGHETRVGRRGNRVASRGCMLQILWEFPRRTRRWKELKGLLCHWPFTQLGLTSLMFWLPIWRQVKSCYRTRVGTFRILMLFYPHSLYSVCQIHVFQPWVVVILFQEWNAKKKNFACSFPFAKK